MLEHRKNCSIIRNNSSDAAIYKKYTSEVLERKIYKILSTYSSDMLFATQWQQDEILLKGIF